MYPEAHSEGLSPHQMIHGEQLDKEIMRGILQNALSLCMVDALGGENVKSLEGISFKRKKESTEVPFGAAVGRSHDP